MQTETGSADVVPIIQVRVPLEEAIQLLDIFAAVGIDLVAVDVSTGDAIRDANGKVVLYGIDNTNWIQLMARNSVFHRLLWANIGNRGSRPEGDGHRSRSTAANRPRFRSERPRANYCVNRSVAR